MDQTIRIPYRAALIAGAIAVAAGFAQSARGVEGYITDSSGNIIRSGSCIETGAWSPSEIVPECLPGQVKAKAEPETRAQAANRISLETDTTFGFDSVQLTDEGRRVLDQLVQTSKNTEQARVSIVGYADRIGPERYNEDLSRRRAEAVKDYLVNQGMPADRVTVTARGESDPVVQCEGVSGDALINCLSPNRRTDIEFAAFEPAGTGEQQGIEKMPQQMEKYEVPAPGASPQELLEQAGTLGY